MSDDDTVDNVLAVGEQVEAVGGVLENGLDLISLGDMKHGRSRKDCVPDFVYRHANLSFLSRYHHTSPSEARPKQLIQFLRLAL